jgi:hypothetical protein
LKLKVNTEESVYTKILTTASQASGWHNSEACIVNILMEFLMIGFSLEIVFSIKYTKYIFVCVCNFSLADYKSCPS